MDPYNKSLMPLFIPVNGAVVFTEALGSFDSLNTNLSSDVINPTILANYPSPTLNSTLPTMNYLPSQGGTSMERYLSLPSSNNVVTDDSSMVGSISRSGQGGPNQRKKQQPRKTTSYNDPPKSKLQTCQSHDAHNPISKKPRVHGNHEYNIDQQIFQELLLKELQNGNPQVQAMIKQHHHKNMLHQLILNSAPQLRHSQLCPPKQQMQVLDVHRQESLPLLDGAICSRRFMQYLYHMRNRALDNAIGYWRKFVAEYYAPGSKQRWCFCKYKNVELLRVGVFCPKAMELWICDICGSRSGHGLEANFELLPRLLKMKFETGMIDEIVSLDLPRACRTLSGLVLEYTKATQMCFFENFRVVHEGKLRLVFRQDLKILSLEFCAHSREELLLHTTVVPQIDHFVQAAKKLGDDARHGGTRRASSANSQANLNRFVSAGNQLKRTIEMPMVNDLGYPKQFIRCLQIADVVNGMKDLMDISRDSDLGPIEILHKFSQSKRINTSTKNKQENGVISGSGSSSIKFPIESLNSRVVNTFPPAFTLQRPHFSDHSQDTHRALVDNLLHEMTAAKRGNNVQERYRKLNNNELVRQSHYQTTLTSFLNGNDVGSSELSSASSPGKLISDDIS